MLALTHPINYDVIELQLVDVHCAVAVGEIRHCHELLKTLSVHLKTIPPVPDDLKTEDKVLYITKSFRQHQPSP